MEPNQTKRGRRLKPESEAKRAVFSARITQEMKDALEGEAKLTGRSIADVAEMWLQESKNRALFIMAHPTNILLRAVHTAIMNVSQNYYADFRENERTCEALKGALEQISKEVEDIYFRHSLEEHRAADLAAGLPDITAELNNLVKKIEWPGVSNWIAFVCIFRPLAAKAPLQAWEGNLAWFKPHLAQIPLPIALEVLRKSGLELDQRFDDLVAAIDKEERSRDLEIIASKNAREQRIGPARNAGIEIAKAAIAGSFPIGKSSR